MTRLRSTLTFILALVFSQILMAQKGHLFLSGSVLSQPYQFNSSMGSFSGDESSTPPAMQWNFGFLSPIGKSSWVWEAQLSYLHIRATETTWFRDNNNDPILTGGFHTQHITNELGLKAGIGYSTQSRNKKHSGIFVLGASGYLPFLSYQNYKAGDGDWEKNRNYTDGNFEEGILYGMYLKPTYQFRIGKNNSPWSLSIFAEANLIWRNLPNYLNPIFMGGGGMGLSYTLK